MARSNEDLGRRGHSLSWVAIPLMLATLVAVALVVPTGLSTSLPGGSATPVPLTHASLTSGSETWAVQHDGFATASISCANASSCYAVGTVGEGGAFVSMTGSTWSTPTVVAATSTVTSVSCPSAQSCFAVGESSGGSPASIVEQTTNGGATWTQLSMPSPMTSLRAISCSSTSLCAVAGTESISGYSYVAVVTLTPGASPTWDTPFQLAGGTNFGGLSCTSIAYCGAILNGNAFFYSTNTGGTWTAGTTSPPAGEGNNYTNVACASSGTSSTCDVVGYCPSGVEYCYSSSHGVTAGTSDSGTTWVGGGIGASLSEVACGSTTECIALGSQNFACGYSCTWTGPLAATTIPSTGGTTADVLPTSDSSTTGTQLTAVACTDATTCFVGGSYGIEETTDGVHFTPVAFETPYLSQISCGSASDCMAVTGTNGLAATNSGGAQWFNLPPLQNGNCLTTSICDGARSIACSSSTKCILSYDYAEYSGGCGCGQIGLVTNNLGLTWSYRTDASTALGCAEGTTTCEGIGAYASGGWQADLSNDGGSTFTSVAAAITDGSTANAVSCGSASMCLAVGSSADVQLSTYSAGTWTNTAANTGISGLTLNAVSCPTSTTCLAVGNGGAAVLLSVSGTTVTTTNLTGVSGLPSGDLQAVACDTGSTCSVFSYAIGAQTANLAPTGTTFTAITAIPSQVSQIQSAACSATGSCFATGYTIQGGEYGSVVLSTNGIPGSTFLPHSLIASESYGGPDGSRPCFACALKAAGLSAQGFAAEPINTADGDFYESVPIVSIPGIGPNLSFTATYDSQSAQSEVAAGVTSPGPLGWGWSTNNNMSLTGASGGGNVIVNEEGGAEITYLPTASGPGLNGSTCTTSSYEQCYQPAEPDVTAILIGAPTYGFLAFSRNDGLINDIFNYSGQLTAINDANGHSVSFAYGVTTGTNCTATGTACNTETDSAGRVLDIVYTTATGLVSKVIDPAGRTWQFSYDGNNNLVGIENPRTYSETFAYDTSSANATMVHDMTGLTLPNGQPGGPDAGKGYVIGYQESTGSATAPLGYVISQTDPAGLVTSFSYAGDPMNSAGTTTITDPHGNVSQDIYLDGVLESHVNGVNTSHPETTSYVRNSADMPTSVTDGNGNTTTYAYDGNGNLLTSTDAQSHTWTYTYNQYNELLTATPPTSSAAAETINTYDTNGNLQTTATHPSTGSNLTTTYTVCESTSCSVSGNTYLKGETESVADPNGHSTTYTYDSYGDVASSTDAVGDKTTYTYTTIGQLFCSTSPKATHAGVACPTVPTTRVANTTSSTFDSSDTLVASTTDANGQTTNYSYDQDGNQTIVEDPLGHYNVYGYDADDRTTSVVYSYYTSSQTVTTTAYDVAPSSSNPNCLNAVTGATYCVDVTQAQGTGGGALNEVTAHYYDAFGNEVQTTDPGGKVTTNTYDQANNLKTTTNGAGVTTYNYLSNNWLNSEAFSGATSGFTTPSTSTSFTYFGDGVRKTMVDSTGTTTYAYDPYGRLQSVVNGAGATVTYGYDSASNLTCLSYPNSGSTNCQNATSGTGLIAYGYDNANRMTSLKDWNSKTINFGYDYDSNWNGTTYPTTSATSVAETYGYADNLTNETTTNANLSGGSQSITWAPDADELFNSTQANSGTVENYGYDTLNRVTSLAGSDSYTYNQMGSVVTDTPSGGSTTNFGYNTDTALCWSGTGSPTGASCTSPPSGSTTYGNNAINERCWSDTADASVSTSCATYPYDTTTTSYGYNTLGELTCDTSSGNHSINCAHPASNKTTTYAYNGDGLRMSDTPANKSTQQFTWDVSGSVPNLLADGTYYFLYGPNGTPVEQINTSATVNYMVSDPTGVRYEFKIGGGIQGTDTYNPYGQCTSCSANTPFGFEDGYTDNNGLIYLVNRYYDPATDQFISVDPLVNQTGQAFAYSADDPVNASDPSGLCGVNTSSVGGFFSSLGTDLNITSSSNCAHSWVQVGQENFNAGYNSLSSTQQTIDRDTVLGATTALACIVVCEAVIASATATASGIGSSLGALCEVDATACAGFLTAGTVSAAATAAEGLCNAAASVSSSPSQKQYWHDAAKGFRNADLGHLLSKLFE